MLETTSALESLIPDGRTVMRSTEPLPPAAHRSPSVSSASDVARTQCSAAFPHRSTSLPSQRMEDTPSRFAKKTRSGVFLDWNSVKAGSPSPWTDGIAGVRGCSACTRMTPSLVATNNWLGVLPERSLKIGRPKPCVAPPIGTMEGRFVTVDRTPAFNGKGSFADGHVDRSIESNRIQRATAREK